MKNKGKRMKNGKGETQLPEEVIGHIQSFMSGKEAARNAILSKSWYSAWLTRPTLDFDTRYFHILCPESQHVFEEFVTKTMRRYQNLSLKIDSLRLCCRGTYHSGHNLIAGSHNLIVDAMKMGATTVQLEDCSFTLPQEMLASETLLKLSLIRCEVDGNCVIRCSRLKSLTLENVSMISSDFFKDLISCCVLMEELSVSYCRGLPLEKMNGFELHMLKRLFLGKVDVGSIFSSDFASRFPCLKDLSILNCYGCTNIHIASTSLETIRIVTTEKVSDAAKFDVPNVRKFTYSCFNLPSRLSIDGTLEWEFDMSIASFGFRKTSWFMNLKKLLKKFSLSRISLSMYLLKNSVREHEVDVEVVPNTLVVEQLIITAPPTFRSALLVRSLTVFRPKFITHPDDLYYGGILDDVKSIDIFCRRLIEILFISNWKDMFGQFGLKKVNAEIYDKSNAEWQPPLLKKAKAYSDAKVRLQLIWDD